MTGAEDLTGASGLSAHGEALGMWGFNGLRGTSLRPERLLLNRLSGSVATNQY